MNFCKSILPLASSQKFVVDMLQVLVKLLLLCFVHVLSSWVLDFELCFLYIGFGSVGLQCGGFFAILSDVWCRGLFSSLAQNWCQVNMAEDVIKCQHTLQINIKRCSAMP